ncbi:MAG: TfoX/Sxy family protein [Nitrospira sp.]
MRAATISKYKEHGMKPFRPNAKQTLTSFYEVPIDVIEDAETLTQWAAKAVKK